EQDRHGPYRDVADRFFHAGMVRKYGTVGEKTRKKSLFSRQFAAIVFPRMELLMGPLQMIARNVRVDLGRRDVGVAEHGLDRPQIRAVFQEMRRERMPQRVRRHALLDARREPMLPESFPETLPRHRLTGARHEAVLALPPAQKLRPYFRQIAKKRFTGLASERHLADLGAFALHDQVISVEVHLMHEQQDQLRHTQTGGVQQLEHGAVAQPEGRGWIGLRDQLTDVIAVKNVRQLARGGALADLRQRIFLDQLLLFEKAIELPHR